MRILVIYFSFTGQAQRVADGLAAAMRLAGHACETLRIVMTDATAPRTPPISFGTVGAWTGAAKRGASFPIACEPAALLDAEHDRIVLLSNTWSSMPAAPIQTFLRSDAARVLRGREVAIGIVCRGFWRRNLAVTRGLVERAGGRFLDAEVFRHPGGWLGSTLRTVTTMTMRRPPDRIGPFRLPPYGLAESSLAKIAPFAARVLAAAVAGEAAVAATEATP